MKEQTTTTELKFIRPELFKVGAISGVLAAIAILIYSIVIYSIGDNPFGRLKFMFFPIYGLFFAGGMSYFRLKMNNGRMAGPQGILIGITLSTMTTTLYSIFIYILLSTKGIGQTMIERHKIDLNELMIKGKDTLIEGLGEKGYEENLVGVANLSADILAKDQVFGLLATGIFLTFLFMLIIKQK